MRGTTDHTSAKLESEVIRLGTKSTRIKSLEAEIERLKRELKIANTFAVSRRKIIADLQAKVVELEAAFDRAMDMLAEAHAGTERMKEVDAIRVTLKQEVKGE